MCDRNSQHSRSRSSRSRTSVQNTRVLIITFLWTRAPPEFFFVIVFIVSLTQVKFVLDWTGVLSNFNKKKNITRLSLHLQKIHKAIPKKCRGGRVNPPTQSSLNVISHVMFCHPPLFDGRAESLEPSPILWQGPRVIVVTVSLTVPSAPDTLCIPILTLPPRTSTGQAGHLGPIETHHLPRPSSSSRRLVTFGDKRPL